MAAADLLARALAWMSSAQSAPASPDTASIMPAMPTGPTPSAGNSTDLATAIAAALCRRFEGLFLSPYLCPAGVPTIGYGSTHYLDGTPVRLTDPPISRALAEQMLVQSIRRTYLPAVLRLCPGIDSPQRLAAIIDWCYNLGAGQLSASTLRKRINSGRWIDVPIEIRRWNRGGGRVLRGLVLRREAEAVMI
jgi:lysozyme